MSEKLWSETGKKAAYGESGAGRLALVDALKAFGSQFIVLHHLAFYGPMSDWTYQLMPDVVEWFSQHARMAVQVFLVVAGFLAARSLAPQGVLRTADPLGLIRKRYVRTALPYIAALLLSMVGSELASQWMLHDSIPNRAEWGQFLAHALLLHSVLGADSLSAGVWYVAIDFQLFVSLVLLLWLSRVLQGRLGVAAASVVVAVLVSLYVFNLDSDWDVWAPYFFGSYGLGVLAYWMTSGQRRVAGLLALAVVSVLVVGALAVSFRSRIVLALAVAWLLALAQQGDWLVRWPRSQMLGYLGQISYSVFLVNFPVALVINAAFVRFAPPNVWIQTLGVLVAWGACNLVGAMFFHGVEQRLTRLGSARRAPLPVETTLTSST